MSFNFFIVYQFALKIQSICHHIKKSRKKTLKENV
jgi:hypothetical protein